MAKRNEQNDRPPLSEEEKGLLRERTNKGISRLCSYAALVIILVALASFILGKSDGFYAQIGIMVSIALLAIAGINDPSRK